MKNKEIVKTIRLKVGDYVRTKYGIAKLIKIKDDKYCFDNIVAEYNSSYEHEYLKETFESKLKKNIIKSSPNITDLIEVGDYVNGRYVDKYQGKLGNFCELPNGKWEFIEIANEHYLISSIVTKEQFESTEYKIER